MSKNKWEKFYSAHSPVTGLNKPNTGPNRYLSDWQRIALKDTPNTEVQINGTSLEKHAANYNNFRTEQDLNAFFRDVILKRLPDNQKNSAIKYLETSFHQGGLLYPVSSVVNFAITNAGISATIEANSIQRRIQIVSTASGFKVQESMSGKELLVPDGSLNGVAGNIATSDMDKDFVLKAQATIDVDFSKSTNQDPNEPSQPSITVESNTITYGHSYLKEKMDKRSLGQSIVDFFKRILGLNKVVDISPSPKVDHGSKNDKNASINHELSGNTSSDHSHDEANEPPSDTPKMR